MGFLTRPKVETTMDSFSPTTYDAVLYPGFALPQAHPDRLATLATLFGLAPAEVSRCRVLELGCGDGTNLISVAMGLPQVKCVGIDLAAAGIQKGQTVAHELGITNVTLSQHDLMEVSRDFGQFDFIIAHGLYSWVPAQVRDKLLAICKENLADNGVTYVSYNTYPGGHFRDMVREMMRYHVQEFTDPQQRVTQARALVEFLAREAKTDGDVYRLVLQKECERIGNFRDSSLFHDDLSECNAPVYFSQFIAHATQHGLQYLSEAQFFETQAGIFPPQVAETLNRIADSVIAKEQYLDFLKGRRFRQTLLCHAQTPLNYQLRPEKIEGLFIAAPIHTESPHVDLQSRTVVAFHGPEQSSIETDDPLVKAAMLTLSETWPQAIHFDSLLAKARTRCGYDAGGDIQRSAEEKQKLASLLLRAYAGGVVSLHVSPPQAAARPGERPLASPLARLQSVTSDRLTNLRHHTISIADSLSHCFLRLLDGSRDRGALLDDLVALVESGTVTIETNGQPVSDTSAVRQFLSEGLERNLNELTQMSLIMQ
jgi:methyltransferase-like protein/2-polyprenyl-3-methyl-5-hydroxy-6-metoxy-1,4-benzoquinol methylase